MADAAQGHAFAGQGGGGHEGAGFDAVRDDVVDAALELLDAFDGDDRGAGALDFGAHRVEEIGEVHDFRFAGGGGDGGDAFGEGGGHHHVVGTEHGGTERAAEVDGGAFQAVGRGEDDIAAFDGGFRSEGFQSADVEIDRAVSDDAAAGQGDDAAALAGEQRAHDADRGAHAADDVVGRGVRNVGGGDADGAGEAFDIAAEAGEDLHHVIGVGHVRDAADDAIFLGQQGGGEDRQRGVFRAGNGDGAVDRGAAVNDELVHLGCGERLNRQDAKDAKDLFWRKKPFPAIA